MRSVIYRHGGSKYRSVLFSDSDIKRSIRIVHCGFDWEQKEEVWNKVNEEIGEVREAVASGDASHIEEEFGDLLFSVINAARLYKVNADTALERTNQKFTKRFNYIEAKAKEQGKMVNELSLDEMEVLWNEAKKQ